MRLYKYTKRSEIAGEQHRSGEILTWIWNDMYYSICVNDWHRLPAEVIASSSDWLRPGWAALYDVVYLGEYEPKKSLTADDVEKYLGARPCEVYIPGQPQPCEVKGAPLGTGVAAHSSDSFDLAACTETGRAKCGRVWTGAEAVAEIRRRTESMPEWLAAEAPCQGEEDGDI